MQLKVIAEEKTKSIELVMSENQELQAQLQEMIVKAKNVEGENKMLMDRWMLQKMQEAEHLNEVFFLLFLWLGSNTKLGLDDTILIGITLVK